MPAFLELSPALVESVSREETAYGEDPLQVNKIRAHVGRQAETRTGRWSNHKVFLASVGENPIENGIHRLSQIEDLKITEGTSRSVKRLLHDWVAAQAAVVSCDGAAQCEKYVPVSGTTIIHLRPSQQPARRKDSEIRGNHRALKSFAKQEQKDILFLIGFQSHSKDDASAIRGMPNGALHDESTRYFLFEAQMFSDEEEYSGKEASGKVFGTLGGLPVKVGSCEVLYCRRLFNCFESTGPTLSSLRWLGDALEKAFFREFFRLSLSRHLLCIPFTFSWQFFQSLRMDHLMEALELQE
jgi:hypothetical protein